MGATDLFVWLRPTEDLDRQPLPRSASGDVEGVLKEHQ
jgi:hypothetical protein